MTLSDFISTLKHSPDNITFNDTIAVIEENYIYTPSEFKNGDVVNEAGANEGSCKIFAFSKLQNFDVTQTLACFGDYYRKDVLLHPDANDHANIRNFMRTGWNGIQFSSNALTPR